MSVAERGKLRRRKEHPTMIGSEEKQPHPHPLPKIKAVSESLHRAEKYNKKDGECEWPINLIGKIVKPCNFNIQLVEKIPIFNTKKSAQIIKLPAGTNLYHGTIISRKGKPWFIKKHPSDTNKGGVWFTSTLEHQGNVNATYVLQYTTIRDMYGVFEQNLWNIGKGTTGNEYIPYFNMLEQYIQKHYNINIEFYAGCNECEIYILNDSVKTVMKTNPIVLTAGDTNPIVLTDPKRDTNPYRYLN